MVLTLELPDVISMSLLLSLLAVIVLRPGLAVVWSLSGDQTRPNRVDQVWILLDRLGGPARPDRVWVVLGV